RGAGRDHVVDQPQSLGHAAARAQRAAHVAGARGCVETSLARSVAHALERGGGGRGARGGRHRARGGERPGEVAAWPPARGAGGGGGGGGRGSGGGGGGPGGRRAARAASSAAAASGPGASPRSPRGGYLNAWIQSETGGSSQTAATAASSGPISAHTPACARWS